MAFSSALTALTRRGVVANVTAGAGPGVDSALARAAAALSAGGAGAAAPPVSAYAGFDPTAPSLHLGHAPVLVLLQALRARAGVRPVALVGGATALVGDPTGRRDARPLLSADAAAANAAGVRACLDRALDFTGGGGRLGAVLVDNAAFWGETPVTDFLRDVGRHVRVGAMLARDSVRARLAPDAADAGGGGGGGGGGADAGPGRPAPAASSPVAADGAAPAPPPASDGLSFAELAYQVLQAGDFARLAASHNAVLQVGGADQWGNIVAGVDLIRRSAAGGGGAGEAHGLTTPLLLAPDGRKFGKSEGNAVWLDPALTSHHAFWQYLAGRSDGEVGALLRALTHAPDEELAALEAAHAAEPERKRAQAFLADAVTLAFRGQDAVDTARRCGAVLFAGTAMWADAAPAGAGGGGAGGGGAGARAADALPQRALLPSLRATDLLALAAGGDVAAVTLPAAAVAAASMGELAVAAGLYESKGEARRAAAGGGLYWNWARVGNANDRARVPEDFVDGRVGVVSAGKRRMAIVCLA